MSTVPAPARIRAARPYDAAALLELKHQLDRETAFMMYEPDERDRPVHPLRRFASLRDADPARGLLMKTVKESRHPFVHVFLMAAQ